MGSCHVLGFRHLSATKGFPGRFPRNLLLSLKPVELGSEQETYDSELTWLRTEKVMGIGSEQEAPSKLPRSSSEISLLFVRTLRRFLSKLVRSFFQWSQRESFKGKDILVFPVSLAFPTRKHFSCHCGDPFLKK
ncbi:hypothetical protein V6N13_065730 [Hibiscus sabdariffa]